jgi:arginyl-tRNA synthetase
MRDEIVKVLAMELKGKLKKEEINSLVEIPPSDDMGDYAFPCFSLAKIEKKSPLLIAENLKEKLKLPNGFSNADAKAGYVNFFVDKKILAENTLKEAGKFKKEKREKVLLEHTSINPNASPHVGRARNSFIGDSLKRILEFKGHNVETHYYVNDVSKQIAMLALVFKSGDKFEDLLKRYVDVSKKIKKDKKIEKRVFDLLNKFEKGDKKVVSLFKKIVDTAIKGQNKIFSGAGIDFDFFDYESKFMETSRKLLKEFEKTGKLFEDKEGRLVLNQEGVGLEKKMKAPVLVLTRGDKTGLYVLRDFAYTIDKMKKGKNIIVLGEDQKLYFEQLKQGLILLGKKAPEVVHYSFVLLKDSGKMSTRKGDVVLLENFLEKAEEKAKKEIIKRGTKGDAKKVAIAAVKYAMLRNDNNKSVIFDLDESLRFEGNTGPYLLYSYARASSIVRKAKSKKPMKILDLKDEEVRLLKKVASFSDVVNRSYETKSPNLIANYSYEIASLFNEFYHCCPVLGNEEEGFRLKLVEAFRVTLKKSLDLLGIDVLEEM